MKELSSAGKELQATVTSGLNMWRAPEGNGAAARTGRVGSVRAGEVMRNKREACWLQRELAAFAQSMQTLFLQDGVRTKDKMIHVSTSCYSLGRICREKSLPRRCCDTLVAGSEQEQGSRT